MDFDFNRLLADAAHELAGEPTVVTTLDHLVSLCTEAVRSCDGASISVLDSGQIRTLAASSDSLVEVDRLQQELGQGPCCDAVRSLAVRSHADRVAGDLVADRRWPEWGPRANAVAGVRSLLSYRLFSSEDSAGTLTLYAAETDAFGHEDLLEGQVLAAHASVALATDHKERQLQDALERRTVIGQATGILIERFGLTPDQAFAAMRRVSQQHNVKLHAIAQHLVDTGVLLDSFRHDASPADAPLEGEPGR